MKRIGKTGYHFVLSALRSTEPATMFCYAKRRRFKPIHIPNKIAGTSPDILYGRSKANNFEPYILSILYTLNQMWDTKKYEKETAPIVDSLDELESSNQIKGKIYAY